MTRTAARLLSVVVFVLGLSGSSLGQLATGTPRYGSFGGGPFDTVNLANLNVHFAIPVMNKVGRGMPFTYTLSYDSSVWYPTGTSGSQTWVPVSNWGWRGQTEVATGYISYTIFTTTCFDPDFGQVTSVHWRWTGYHDSFGVNHTFGFGAVTSDGQCSGITDITKTATDGSGYTLIASAGTAYVTSSSGQIIHAPLNSGTGSADITDANGNKITVDSSGHFTDTLGTTALTAAGAGTQASPSTFTYTSPANTSVSFTMHYTNKTLRTYFQCSGIADYGPITNVPLVTDITLPDSSQYLFTYEPSNDPNNPGSVTGRIASVTLPTGGTITYTYSGGTHGINCVDGAPATLTRTLNPGGTWTYDRAGTAPSWTTTVTDPTTPTANHAVINFQDIYQTQRKTYQGSVSGTPLNTTITCYNGNGVSTPSSCPTTAVTLPILRTTVFTYLPDSLGLQAKTDRIYDNFGLINEVDDYDYGSAAVGPVLRKTITTYAALTGIVDRPSSVVIKDANNNIKANTTYGYDETAVTTTSGTPQHVAVSGSRGNLTTVAAQANGSITLYRKFTYYDTGTLKTSTDVSTSSTTPGATTTYTYASGTSCGNSFVTSITEAIAGLSRSMTWDCTGGVLTSLTDENGKISSTAYSGTSYTNVFWRPYSTTDEAGNTTYRYYSLNPTQTESKLTFNSGSSVADQLTTQDGFGRSILNQTKQGPSSNYYDTVETDYEVAGCGVSRTTLPYSGTAGQTSPSAPGTTTTHDALCRVTNLTDSGGGSTAYIYTKNDTYQTVGPAPTQQKQQEYDALGRLTSVCEVTGAAGSGICSQTGSQPTGYWTKYAYDVLGNRTTVTQNAQAAPASQQSRTYAFDMLGRNTSETTPETNNLAYTYVYDKLTSDASCGTVTSAGNLLKRVDAAGTAACYSGYDALHRVGSTTYPSTSTPAKYFVYDSATVGGTPMSLAKTRLAESYTCTTCPGTKITDLGFTYSERGEIKELWESTPHSTSYYHLTSGYWENGALKTLSGVPGLPTITYGADGEGRATTVSASSGQNPVTATSYNASSQVTALTFGSSDNDIFNFDSNTGSPILYQFNMGTGPVKSDTGVPTWNQNGTLQQLVITDQITPANSQTCVYGYDDLARLASANCGASLWNQTFSYDPFGNITKTVPQGSTGMSFQPTYDSTKNRITSSPFTYDGNNGNLTTDNSHAYTWDAEGKMITVDSGTANGVCLTYDALGRMVEQARGSSCSSSYTEIVYSPTGSKLALMNGQTLTKAFVSLPGRAQAVYNASGLQYYRHADWLGSSRLATTPSRAKYYDVAYAPFGEPYAASGTQDLSFTGQNQDTVSSVVPGGAGGLYDFLFRELTPVQGRWLSPDPAGLAAVDPSDPQSWNRYAYVGNSPMNRVDPLGLYCDAEGQPVCGCYEDDDNSGGGGGAGGRGGGGGGGGGGGDRRFSRFPNGESLGLPTGLNLKPASWRDLVGLSPGTGCDWGVCAPVGNGFSPVEGAIPWLVGLGIRIGSLLDAAAGLLPALLLSQVGDAAPCVHLPGGCLTRKECDRETVKCLEGKGHRQRVPDCGVCQRFCYNQGYWPTDAHMCPQTVGQDLKLIDRDIESFLIYGDFNSDAGNQCPKDQESK